jgi:hypothetical protein
MTHDEGPVKFYVRASSSNGTTVTVRNAWLRDRTITGNPLHLYLLLISREREGVVALNDAQEALGLSDGEFNLAYLTLAGNGYLMRVRGNPLNALEGHPVTYFTQDPIVSTDSEQGNAHE